VRSANKSILPKWNRFIFYNWIFKWFISKTFLLSFITLFSMF